MAKKKKQAPLTSTSQAAAPPPAPAPTPTLTKRKGKGKAKPSSPIACVIPNLLYLSPVSATGNEVLLQRDGITHVISIGRNPWAQVDGIVYHRLGLKDEEDAEIRSVVERVCEIMDGIVPPVLLVGRGGKGRMEGSIEREENGEEEQEVQAHQYEDKRLKGKGEGKETNSSDQDKKENEGLKNNKRVLFHCSAAISRSPAIVAGYLMKRRGLTLRESLGMLVTAREAVSPNLGFMRQLCEMEREVFGLGDGVEGSLDVRLLEGDGRLVNHLGRI